MHPRCKIGTYPHQHIPKHQLHEESPIEVERFEPKKRRQVIRIGNVVIKTRPKEVKEGPHHPRPGYACAYLYRDVSFYITVSKPDGTVLYENFVGESGEFNSGWWPVEHLAVDSVQRAASYLTLDNLIRRNSKTLKDLVGASYMMYAKKVTCYYGKKKKRTKGADPYAEMPRIIPYTAPYISKLRSHITAITDLFSFVIERTLLSILSANNLKSANDISSSFAMIHTLSLFCVACSSNNE